MIAAEQRSQTLAGQADPLFSRDEQSVRQAVQDAAHYLPAQGPIAVFIHHNTLHAFEHEPFEQAVVHAAGIFDTAAFLTEDRYREALATARIRLADIDAVLDREFAGGTGDLLAGGKVTARAVRRAVLAHDIRCESDVAVRWILTESDAIERLRRDLNAEMRWRQLSEAGDISTDDPGLPLNDRKDEETRRVTFEQAASAAVSANEHRAAASLWHACVESIAFARPAVLHCDPPVRYRDLILAVDETIDTDALVHPLLIRLSAAFLDQGVASWPMPGRESGFLAAVAALQSVRRAPTEPWSHRLPEAFRAVRNRPASQCIIDELHRLGIPREAWAAFVRQSLLALRGWAGMMRQFEERPDRAPVTAVPATLTDFLAVRLICDRVATEWARGRLRMRAAGRAAIDLSVNQEPLGSFWGELRDRFPPHRGPGGLARAYLLHQVCQLVGLTGRDLRSLDENELRRLESEILAFDGIARRRIFHLAYERRYRVQTLDALAAHARTASQAPRPESRVQFVLCIDDRCESFRRHVEEIRPDYETFGAAGFFSVPMYYQGIDDWHPTPLCPIAIRPEHTVTEEPVAAFLTTHRFRQTIRRRYGQLAGGLSTGSRTLLRGGFVAGFMGTLAAVPLVMRVAFPRLTARVLGGAGRLSRRRITTRLRLEAANDLGPSAGTRSGFTVPEMAAIVRRVLEDIGLTSRLSALVVILGHGSSSLNNPHESAHDCGACGGGRGGPNARAFALMANDPRVRVTVLEQGLHLPESTWFVGGMLDTCSNTVTWYDEDRIPASHRHLFAEVQGATTAVCMADAHERCRRFESASPRLGLRQAAEHVEARSVDLAQPRPEYGHATVAACVIGRRWRTRGLFLDRRFFLVSYDPLADSDGDILRRTLAAVGPVGAGISLEYFFSSIDPLGYGAGTKLPHNISGLLGVMDGHASDLRTGLPWQMVEIHEPMRLLVVIEASQQRILEVLRDLPAVQQLAENRWIQLVAWDPESGQLATFAAGAFQPYTPERHDLPVVDRSIAWYSGHRDHLPPASVLAATVGAATTARHP
jgi:uncharacterized protein YbcC (UPF0753/DUF2309 family)